MLHRCLYHVAGLMQSSASRGLRRSNIIIVPIMKGCGRLGTRLSMIGQAMLQMLSAIWRSVLKKIRSLTGHHRP